MQGSLGFPGVLGHAAIQQRLVRALSRGHLHHAMLFVGPRGVGKATMARGLARALHCTVAPRAGCGTCDSCRRIGLGRHTGVEWIEPEEVGGKIKVEVARELRARLLHAPFEGDAHVVVIDPGEALTEQAFNALLKSIEEPRPGVYFVVIASSTQALLPTIVSRCMPVRFGPLGEDVVRQLVDAHVGDEVSDERRQIAVRMATGSAGLAIELASEADLERLTQLLSASIEAIRSGPAAIFAGEEAPLWNHWQEAVGSNATGRPARERQVAKRLGELWLLHLREHLRTGSGLPRVHPAPTEPRQLLRTIDRVQTFARAIDRNPNVRLALESTLLELADL